MYFTISYVVSQLFKHKVVPEHIIERDGITDLETFALYYYPDCEPTMLPIERTEAGLCGCAAWQELT